MIIWFFLVLLINIVFGDAGQNQIKHKDDPQTCEYYQDHGAKGASTPSSFFVSLFEFVVWSSVTQDQGSGIGSNDEVK